MKNKLFIISIFYIICGSEFGLDNIYCPAAPKLDPSRTWCITLDGSEKITPSKQWGPGFHNPDNIYPPSENCGKVQKPINLRIVDVI